ncbi:MAG: TIM barrel protein [Pleurocapsa minor GSE-CHR-MK-17-07R]|jgi:sugar phosphate isomerase/epimerase|nr:TIM barrel protein [Pleurocapsa minor GSE-CHR-MK 17-07R]
MELVLWTTADGLHNFPDAAQVARLKAIASAHDMTYTVHLPMDVQWTDGCEHESLALAARVVVATSDLPVHSYVFHLEGTDAGSDAWHTNRAKACAWLCDHIGIPREKLAAENLENYAPDHVASIADNTGVGRTFDIGHVWKQGGDPLALIPGWLPQARVVHLHGAAPDGHAVMRDHLPLSVMPEADIDAMIDALWEWDGVLTLEVFEGDYAPSRAALDESIRRVAAARG